MKIADAAVANQVLISNDALGFGLRRVRFRGGVSSVLSRILPPPRPDIISAVGRRWSETSLPGVLVGEAYAVRDDRGLFVKPWARSLSSNPLRPDEVFFSTSDKGVVRGMHVQRGRAAGHRLIFATQGVARDFVIDLRIGSPSFGQVIETMLEPGGLSLFVPPGCAHGFESLATGTTMVYVQEGGYDPELDIGVHWTSCGLVPQASEPLVSERDALLPHLSNFKSPFSWSPV